MELDLERAAMRHEQPFGVPSDLSERRRGASTVIKEHVMLALAAGLIPAPVVDAVAIAALEIDMIGDLARVYAFPVPHKLVVYKILISLVGSIWPVYFAGHLHSAYKSVPLLGYALAAGTMSINGGVSVYAVGKIFQKHFESGGTFLSSDSSILRKFFKESEEEGKEVVRTYIR